MPIKDLSNISTYNPHTIHPDSTGITKITITIKTKQNKTKKKEHARTVCIPKITPNPPKWMGNKYNNMQYDMSCLSTSKVNTHVHRQVPWLPLATSLPARCLLLHHQSSQPQGSSHTLSQGKWINILILDDGCCWQQGAVNSSNSPACPSSDLLFSFHQAYLLPRLFVLCWNLRVILDYHPFPFVPALLFYSAFVSTDPVSSNCNYPFPSAGLHPLQLLTRCI